MPSAPRTFREAAAELLTLSVPFVLSTSFTTVQMLIDRRFLSAAGADAVAAAMPAAMYFWAPLCLLQFTVLYATVFVAQYRGAGRPRRIGPVVWQALWFALAAGALFPLLRIPAGLLIDASDHAPKVKELESAYFHTLVFAAPPMLITSATNAFFAGRQRSWVVLIVNGSGAAANALFAIPLILWQKHDAPAAMQGSGYAAALGSSVSAILGLILFLHPRYRAEFATDDRRVDWPLTKRLLRFGIPNGLQYFIETTSFLLFIVLIGNMGGAELAATTITFTVNLLTFLPVMGLGQGVEVLVGQRQGEGRPDLAARSTHAGAALATAYMAFVAAIYVLFPLTIVSPFQEDLPPGEWESIGPLIPALLLFVGAYSLADGANIVYAFGLRGAGDTRFVSVLAIALSWPLMVLPTYLSVHYGWGVTAAWAFATLYVVALAAGFMLRFLGGKWRTMRVIEAANEEPAEADPD